MLKFSNQTLLDTQVTLNGLHFAWIQKQSKGGFNVKFKGEADFTFCLNKVDAKQLVKSCAKIES